jgi:glucose/arabinose dehydrogenase
MVEQMLRIGQNAFEEVDIIEPGKNYGWNEMEGFHTFKDGENSGEYTPPVLEIPQSTGDKSITGGYVYRGSNAPSLTGKYVFADYVSGRIYALTESNEGAYSNSTLMDTDLNIASFGTDQNNELYICAFDGKIYTLKE